jgi:hypothetical protein
MNPHYPFWGGQSKRSGDAAGAGRTGERRRDLGASIAQNISRGFPCRITRITSSASRAMQDRRQLIVSR